MLLQGKDLGSTEFVLANAESLPFSDASMDAVVSVYMFHEIPPQARIRVFREVARVLKPGGMFVLNDSIQLGDRGDEVDKRIPLFAGFNEPHYNGYLQTDFGELAARETDLIAGTKLVGSRSKVLSWTKPL